VKIQGDNMLARHIRRALIGAIDPSVMGGFASMHMTPRIKKAASLVADIVTGEFGSGKTLLAYWLGHCADDGRVSLIRDERLPGTTVHYVWTDHLWSPWTPRSSYLARLCKEFDPYLVWRSIIYEVIDAGMPCSYDEWRQRVKWVSQNPERVARVFETTNDRLSSEDRHLLFVFDDADTAPGGSGSIQGILKNLLDLQPFSNMHGKVLTRGYVFDDPNLTAFRDSSKLLASKVDLAWTPTDLHKALWHRLVNLQGEQGYLMRGVFTHRVNHKIAYTRNDTDTLRSIWSVDVPEMDTRAQRKLFDDLAGKGSYRLIKDHNPKTPYEFFTIVHTAARKTEEKYPDHDHPINKKFI